MMILTPEELVELTRRSRADAQMRVLNGMGIQHRRRPDGSVVVSRANVDAALGVTPAPTKANDFELNLGAVA